MNKSKNRMAEKILNHALGIIYLLTGEEYVIVKKNSPHSTMPLLTGEVPIKCGDISIYFSMEEWGYIEEHKDLYQNVVGEEEIPVDRSSGPCEDSFNNTLLGKEKTSAKDIGQVDFYEESSAVYSVLTDVSLDRSIASESHTGTCSPAGTLEDDTSTSHGFQEGNSSIDSSLCDIGSHTSWEREAWTVNDNVISKDVSRKKIHTQKKKSKISATKTLDSVIPQFTENTGAALLCEHCGQSFLDRSNLAAHKRTHSGKKSYTCNQCGKHFAHESHLTAHMRSHSGGTCYWCGDCGLFFSYKSQLLVHQRTHIGERIHRCDDCGQTFEVKSLLLVHQQVHTGLKPHRCSECGERFAYRSGLVVHERTHSGEKPHRCKDCGKNFTDVYSLFTHQKVHRVTAPHKCSECGMQFEYKASLIVHQRTHKGLRHHQYLVRPRLIQHQRKQKMFSSNQGNTSLSV